MCQRRDLWPKRHETTRNHRCKTPPREARVAEWLAQAAGRGQLTGNPHREAPGLPGAKGPVSETTSTSQVIWVLAPEDILELIN